MTVDKNLDDHLKALTPILDEYMEWFMQLVCRIIYPQGDHQEQIYARPTSLIEWLDAAEGTDSEKEILTQLGELGQELDTLSDKLINETLKTKEIPAYSEFTKLVDLFELFIGRVRRIERDMLLEKSGLDSQTGLRTLQMLGQDFDIEMERLTRQGKPFSVVLFRIINYQELKDQGEKHDLEGALKMLSDMIVRSMRNFDDAYRISEDEFVLCLKQSDRHGGVMAMERLRKAIEPYQEEEGAFAPQMISCIAEPSPGDVLDQLIDSLRLELDEHDESGSGAVLEHVELSPLQKFIKKGEQ